MVLFEIDPDGITALPFKHYLCNRQPHPHARKLPLAISHSRVGPRSGAQPNSVHCKSVTHWPRVQRMEPPPRHAQIIKRFCAMKRLKPATDALYEVRTNTARVVIKEEVA